MRRALALCVMVALFTPPLPAAMPPVISESGVPTLAPMIRKISPAVVNIATRGTIRERGAQKDRKSTRLNSSH